MNNFSAKSTFLVSGPLHALQSYGNREYDNKYDIKYIKKELFF